MICKGCNEEAKLIKAHIIPESFFTGFRNGNRSARIISDIKGKYPKKSHIGIYDENILCRKCEDRFQIVDDYGCRVLLGDKNNLEEIVYEREVVGYKLSGVDYSLLKRFFISVLWRASLSTHEYYAHVNLGPYENIAKDLIWTKSSGSPEEFDFVLCKFTEQGIGRAMLDPRPEQCEGINCYRVYMYGYVLQIKVDKRKSPKQFDPFKYKNDNTIMLMAREIKDSQEFNVLKNIARNARK